MVLTALQVPLVQPTGPAGKDGAGITKQITNTTSTVFYVMGKSTMLSENITDANLYVGTSVHVQNGTDLSAQLVSANRISATTINATTINATNGFYETSDEKVKDIDKNINIDIDKLCELRKFYFTFKNDENKTPQIGVSAQEVQKLYPELVSENDDGYLSVDYAKLSVIALMPNLVL